MLGWSYSKITDPVVIRLFYRKNSEEIPPELSKVQRKAEEIIKDNVGSFGSRYHNDQVGWLGRYY